MSSMPRGARSVRCVR
ncbi:hypothetical protein BRX36_02930 [Sphingomonas sp. S-NIH.Pt1_0416]|nr:hypothetical protein DRN02_002415 [Sphingomonas paucimobilis]RSU68599.1 hypothetical protein BRX36_02930 [Sphingomonas sp. S-NIH.Pt1_0416]